MSMNSFHARTARPKPKAAVRPAAHAHGVRADALLVQQGLTESLAGRFEMIRLPHWSFDEMRQAFG